MNKLHESLNEQLSGICLFKFKLTKTLRFGIYRRYGLHLFSFSNVALMIKLPCMLGCTIKYQSWLETKMVPHRGVKWSEVVKRCNFPGNLIILCLCERRLKRTMPTIYALEKSALELPTSLARETCCKISSCPWLPALEANSRRGVSGPEKTIQHLCPGRLTAQKQSLTAPLSPCLHCKYRCQASWTHQKALFSHPRLVWV